jgi:hypothetical protein
MSRRWIADHHDLVLAITSHLPHLIAYTIVHTAEDLQPCTRSEVLKFSAGGFRDFTRIAASDPTMWRDVFLANKDAVLEMLGRFNEDVAALTKAIRRGDGDALFEQFTRTRAIRKGIVEIGQDVPGSSAARIPACRNQAAAALRRRRGLEERRDFADLERPQHHRAVDDLHRYRDGGAALDLAAAAQEPDAERHADAEPLPGLSGERFTKASRPATVMLSCPSRRPCSLSESVPPPTAIVSPCWIRILRISMRPLACWISRNRAGHGLGEKSFRPLNPASILASVGTASSGPVSATFSRLVSSATSITGGWPPILRRFCRGFRRDRDKQL